MPTRSSQQTASIRNNVQSVVSAFLEKIFRPEEQREEIDGPSTDDSACDASQEPPSDSSDLEQLKHSLVHVHIM